MIQSDANKSIERQSDGGFFSHAISLSVLARTIHADLSPLRRFKKTVQFCFNGMRYKQEFLGLQDVLDSPQLVEVRRLFPAILEKSFNPYVRIDWDCAQRHEKIGHHFLFLKNLFGEHTAEIYKPEGYTLFEFSDGENERYSVELFPGYQNEGSMGIRLCDSRRREIYTVSLHLSSAEENACYIGALQGPNDRIPERQKAIVALTRSLHGLRPKALMLEALYMMVDTLGIEHMYGISNAGHIYNASVYSKDKRNAVHFDRDQMWKEYRAERISECLFKFPARPVRKDIASLKANKRSMYRKRYAWLSQVAYDADDAINALRVQPVKTAVLYDINKVA